MSNKERRQSTSASEITQINLSPSANTVSNQAGERTNSRTRSRLWPVSLIGLILLFGLGVMASNGWLPHTDGTGKKTGWFGKELSKTATNSWNPFAQAPPPPTTQLSKEY